MKATRLLNVYCQSLKDVEKKHILLYIFIEYAKLPVSGLKSESSGSSKSLSLPSLCWIVLSRKTRITMFLLNKLQQKIIN